jgi:hypothetical protein
VRLGKLESIGKLVNLGIDGKAQYNKKMRENLSDFPHNYSLLITLYSLLKIVVPYHRAYRHDRHDRHP